jgi:hypothetical protein
LGERAEVVIFRIARRALEVREGEVIDSEAI